MSAERICRRVLALYPRDFRARYGEEWMHALGQRLARERRRGRTLRFWSYLVRDTLWALPGAYLAQLRDRRAEPATGFRRGPAGAGFEPARGPDLDDRAGLREQLRGDIAFALRGLIRRPAFAAATVFVLAVGIGANTAIFSVLNAALLRPLPYPDGERLAIVWNDFRAAGFADAPVSGPQLAAMQEHPGLFVDAGGVWATSSTLTGTDAPAEQLSVGLTTWSFLEVLGVQPVVGRLFEAADVATGPGGARQAGAVILSHRLWRSRFAGSPDIVGATIYLEGGPNVVVGVLPAGFRLLFPEGRGVPARLDLYALFQRPLMETPPDQYFFRAVGRLRPGIGVDEATEQLAVVAEQLRSRYAPLADADVDLDLRPVRTEWVRDVRPALLALQVAVGLLLLLSTANVANLLIARTMGRGRELALRASLGASRGRLATQLLVEGSVLALLGGAAGLALGRLAVSALWSLRPPALIRLEQVTLDTNVLLCTLLVSLGAALMFCLAPVVMSSRSELMAALSARAMTATRHGERSRRAVTVAEVAIGLVLLVGAGLMGRSLSNLLDADLGFLPRDRVVFKVSLSLARFPEATERARLARELENALGELPDVDSVGAVSHLPFEGTPNWASEISIPGSGDNAADRIMADHRAVTPGYLDAVGARLEGGRGFTVHDTDQAGSVAIVDRILAARLWPESEGVGRRLNVTHYVDGSFEQVEATVIGIVAPLRDQSLTRGSAGQVYLPFAQTPRWELGYVLSSARPATLVEPARRAISGVHAELAPSEFRMLEDGVADAAAGARFGTVLATIFAGAALLVAAVGLYGVVAYRALARTREIGIRMALGARRNDVFRSILGDGLWLGLLGSLVGLPAAYGAARLYDSLLFGVGSADPATYGMVAALMIGIVVLAGAVPARRASRVDPAVSLRAE